MFCNPALLPLPEVHTEILSPLERDVDTWHAGLRSLEIKNPGFYLEEAKYGMAVKFKKWSYIYSYKHVGLHTCLQISKQIIFNHAAKFLF